MDFENVAFSDEAPSSQRKVMITCLTSYVNRSGCASLTFNSDGLFLCYVSVNLIETFMVRVSFLARNLIMETSKAQKSFGKT